jgi:hypothetical protein
LACRVPDLQFDVLALDFNHPCAELDADRDFMLLSKPLVDELEQETRLAHTCVTDEDEFEQITIRHLLLLAHQGFENEFIL